MEEETEGRRGTMSARKPRANCNPASKELAGYFGLTVEIIFRMRNYSVVRWRDRECIVDTEDLVMAAERRAA
jgi:hypothetical protein